MLSNEAQIIQPVSDKTPRSESGLAIPESGICPLVNTETFPQKLLANVLIFSTAEETIGLFWDAPDQVKFNSYIWGNQVEALANILDHYSKFSLSSMLFSGLAERKAP